MCINIKKSDMPQTLENPLYFFFFFTYSYSHSYTLFVYGWHLFRTQTNHSWTID